MKKNRVRTMLDELNRITGLSLELKDTELSKEREDEAVERLSSLIGMYKEKNDRDSIFRYWLMENTDRHMLCNQAVHLHVEPAAFRSIFLIEGKNELDPSINTILEYAFTDNKAWVIPVDGNRIALVLTYRRRLKEEQLQETAYSVVDLLNTEAMTGVKVAYGGLTEHLDQLPSSFRSVSLAMNVCRVFYPEQNVYSHARLGMGHLLHGLSREQCEAYLSENLGDNYRKILDPDMIWTFNVFFNHNLNIAETSRVLYMHRNTLIYQLDQVYRHTGLNARRFDDAMTLKTSFLVLNYLSSMDEVR